jgi:hypothetical protein
MANVIVEFLQWATSGAGCGSRPLRFWEPAGPISDITPMVRLAVLAA